MKRFLLLSLALLAAASLSGENLRFASRPSLSPDGGTVYFT